MLYSPFTRFSSNDYMQSMQTSDRYIFCTEDVVNSRMAAIRPNLEKVRKNWTVDGYDMMMNKLKYEFKTENYIEPELGSTYFSLSDRKLLTQKREEGLQSFEKITQKSNRRNWCDVNIKGFIIPDNYEIIQLYTNDTFYKEYFYKMTSFYRHKDPKDSILESSTFLLELLNIDLYNYIRRNQNNENFQGIVFRGDSIAKNNLHIFKKLLTEDLSARYISTPLGVYSATQNKDIAQRFALNKAEKGNEIPIIFKIYVEGIENILISRYIKYFNKAPISSLCAVPINDISQFQEEKEVLLRGPFFQLLGINQEDKTVIIELLLITANRDHLYTTTLYNDIVAKNARSFFATIVTIARTRFCIKFYKERNMLSEENQYKKLLEQKEQFLNELEKGYNNEKYFMD